MSIGYYAPGSCGSEAACLEIEAAARDRAARNAREDAARAAAHDAMIAAIRRGENGGACPLLAAAFAGSEWLPTDTARKGMTEREARANGIAAWAIENVNAPVYHDAAQWFDVVARVAAGATKGMAGGKGSPKGAAYAAIDAYREAHPEPVVESAASATGSDVIPVGSEVVIPSGPFEGFKGILTAARTATVTLFGRPQIATW